jgi:Ohr subfamily peroxiredoxin
MSERLEPLYTAEATVNGGREGHGRTSDGRLDVDLDVPSEMGGPGGRGTNPEQLFAVGYAACFQSALLRFATGRGLDLGDSRITARVGIGTLGGGGFGLAAALDLHAPGIGHDEAIELMARAHEACPYSRATRGNINVTLTVDGPPSSVARPESLVPQIIVTSSGRTLHLFARTAMASASCTGQRATFWPRTRRHGVS